MENVADLIDELRAAQAKVAGLQLRLCLAVGDRDGAYRAEREQKAVTTARQAATWTAPCFFHEAAARATAGEVVHG